MKCICMECGKRFETRSPEPKCPRCHGYDIEPDTQHYFPVERIKQVRQAGLR